MNSSEIVASLGTASTSLPRVVVFADSPLPSLLGGAVGRGGGQAATWLSQVAEEFAKASDLEFIWVELKSGERDSRIHRVGNQCFVELAHPRQSWDLALNHRLVKWKLKNLLHQLRPDVVHCWGTERLHAAATEVAGCASILSMQGILTRYKEIGGLPAMWQWNALVKAEPRWVKAATVVTSESQWGLDQVRAMGRTERLHQIEYGVHPSFYQLEWNPDPTDPFLLYSGSIDSRKGVDVLIEAAASNPGRRWRLEIAGDGPMREKLERRAIPGVLWLGSLNWNQLQQRLCKAWGFILPTRADTSPNSVKEARVVGLPVITTPNGGQVGYIIDGENGWIVEPLEPSALAAACDRLTTSVEVARAMGANRHARDRDYFLPTNTANSFLKLYRELTER